MAYKRKPKVKMNFTAPKRVVHDTAIEERLAGCGRKEAEHIIYVGELVERILKHEFGAVLRALTAGRTGAELQANRDGKLSADRILGRIEMADALWSDLEQFVIDKDAQLAPIPVADRKPESVSEREQRDIREESFTYSP